MQRWKIHQKSYKNHNKQVEDVTSEVIYCFTESLPQDRQCWWYLTRPILRADTQDWDCLGAIVCNSGTSQQLLKKCGFKMEFRILLPLEYLRGYVSANPLLEAEGKSSWPLSEVSIESIARCRMKCTIAIYCPDWERLLSVWHAAQDEINVSGQGIFYS